MSKLIYVPHEGNPLHCKFVFVGEAPGATEEQQKRPFVGRSGKLLRNTLKELGVNEDHTYITNAVKVRPTDNRTPTLEELISWVPALRTELTMICQLNPNVKIITLGKSAERALNIIGLNFKPIWHPAYILRSGRIAEWRNSIKDILISAE